MAIAMVETLASGCAGITYFEENGLCGYRVEVISRGERIVECFTWDPGDEMAMHTPAEFRSYTLADAIRFCCVMLRLLRGFEDTVQCRSSITPTSFTPEITL